jgi:hypothetical protein
MELLRVAVAVAVLVPQDSLKGDFK